MKLTKSQAVRDRNGKLIKGVWQIDKKHQIRYKATGENEEASLEATILDIEPAAIVLSHTAKQDDQKIVTTINKLTGVWRADDKNRLTFEVEREAGQRDVLTFRNAWRINKNHEIEYIYVRQELKRRIKHERKLVFGGFWDISDKNRITYRLARTADSYFTLRGALETRGIRAKRGEIRYQVGIEVDKKVRTRTVTLFGKWRYSNRYGLSFEVDYKDGRKHAIRFGAEYSPNSQDHIELNLVNTEGKPLGVELVLTRDFLKQDGQAFVKLLKNAEESRIEAGATWRW